MKIRADAAEPLGLDYRTVGGGERPSGSVFMFTLVGVQHGAHQRANRKYLRRAPQNPADTRRSSGKMTVITVCFRSE